MFVKDVASLREALGRTRTERLAEWVRINQHDYFVPGTLLEWSGGYS